MALENKFASQYLKERGIRWATAEAEGVQIQTRSTEEHRSVFRSRLDFDVWNNVPLADTIEEGLWFPCRDSATVTRSWIFRPFPDLPGQNGQRVKFLSSKVGGNYPFIPKATWAAQEKANYRLIMTEGPAKALALLDAGELPIAVSGVWMVAAKKGEGEPLELHAALKEFVLRGRKVYLAFDSDYENNPSVRQALIRAGILFLKEGAELQVLTWPAEKGKGIDDYLVTTRGDLAELFSGASGLSAVIRPCDLSVVVLELSRARLQPALMGQLCRLFAKPLLVSTELLKASIQPERKETALSNPEPWPEPVESDVVWDLVDLITQHVAMNKEQAVAVALWVVLTYLEAHVEILPLLGIHSPVKRCGKTVLLSVLSRLVSKPLQSSNASAAVLYRAIEKWHPSLLVDEIDTWLKEDNDARGIINSGHTREMAFALRCNAESLEPQRFSTWGPKAIAGIGKLADTIADRSINIWLQRREPSRRVVKLRDTDPAIFAEIRKKIIRWALDNFEAVAAARPAIPAVLNDRESDNWFLLLAIADTLGGDWPKEARLAALALSESGDTETASTLILYKLDEILKASPDDTDFLPSRHLTEKLNEDSAAPWADWSHGKGLTEKRLAQILADFGIKPIRKTEDMKMVNGYRRKDLQPVIKRYASPEPPKNDVNPVPES